MQLHTMKDKELHMTSSSLVTYSLNNTKLWAMAYHPPIHFLSIFIETIPDTLSIKPCYPHAVSGRRQVQYTFTLCNRFAKVFRNLIIWKVSNFIQWKYCDLIHLGDTLSLLLDLSQSIKRERKDIYRPQSDPPCCC